ncbi:uncharacterized protein LOC131611138 [Vicia villosa]|uniref:uncharacterized protein LOC131611138 n=1 Tax=Vicia villosa TaxID=3911 RepID=UPI00273B7FD3|nr:uncharacterized protein LOC131611138 [Vicia villosa]
MTRRIYIVLCLLFFCVHMVVLFATHLESNWINHGGDLYNRRYAYMEHKINPITAPHLKLKWKFYAGKEITATPTIYNGILYFPSWNGNIYAIRQIDGSVVWKKNLKELTGLNASVSIANIIGNGAVARASPTVAGDLLMVGIYGPPVVVGLERATGELVWLTKLDDHYAAVVTMSGTYYNGNYYVGVSSLEERATIEDCCVFRGSFVKLDAKTGAILWKTYMLPDNKGQKGEYAGAAIWGSSPSIDIYRKHVYIATGNLYSAPENILECQETQNNDTTPVETDKCIEPENHSNSIIALDLDTGEIKWFNQLGGLDVWFIACINPSTTNCPPQGPIPDSDFAEEPMMLTTHINGTKKDIVVAVQKSGLAWALDRNNGNRLWFKEAGPGGLSGGGMWGAATDENRIYTNIGNSEGKTFQLLPSNINTTAGAWVAMDARNGKILWSTANPSNGLPIGPVSVANDVLFGGSTDSLGHIYAMNARNGKILWSYATGGSVYGGMSISNGCIYVGSGYNVSLGVVFKYTGGTSLFSFCV